MVYERIPIIELQPADTLREDVQVYLAEFSIEQVEGIQRPPQVWDIENFRMISDGNNRIAYCASKGAEDVLVEYKGSCPEEFLFILEQDIEKARQLRSKGIFSPYDFFR